ncbi:uncharacterized protein EI97DRAFT_122371 [Westerdykella ornata]|uniref:Uncharacterized protein n=1 Tax=Westerdykella ornata TaxID=318751 RepID=A0A6A6JVJ3_WESOR|nr:uncharacterized protein EI97DRAFT_122371 [Westerdykella ornata]KAF2280407.1 hypothetical protein EI97DRAFT_122371 [Westerdykella ornata]
MTAVTEAIGIHPSCSVPSGEQKVTQIRPGGIHVHSGSEYPWRESLVMHRPRPPERAAPGLLGDGVIQGGFPRAKARRAAYAEVAPSNGEAPRTMAPLSRSQCLLRTLIFKLYPASRPTGWSSRRWPWMEGFDDEGLAQSEVQVIIEIGSGKES